MYVHSLTRYYGYTINIFLHALKIFSLISVHICQRLPSCNVFRCSIMEFSNHREGSMTLSLVPFFFFFSYFKLYYEEHYYSEIQRPFLIIPLG